MSRKNWNLKKYGIDETVYRKMFEDQNGLCLSCGRPETRKHQNGKTCNLSVDHCHFSGKVRALLCNRCNQVLGRTEDCPKLLRRMADYLENKVTCPPVFDHLTTQLQKFDRSLNKLPKILQEIALDFLVLGLSQKEIAFKFGKSQPWVSVRQAEILAKLHADIAVVASNPEVPSKIRASRVTLSLEKRQADMKTRMRKNAPKISELLFKINALIHPDPVKR